MKPIRFTQHAREQCVDRGNEEDVTQAILDGSREIAKRDRILCRYNFSFGQSWNGKKYQIKQVAPVIKCYGYESAAMTFPVGCERSSRREHRYHSRLRS